MTLAILAVSFAVLLLFGFPVSYSMGLSGLVALLFGNAGYPLEVVPQRIYATIDSFSLLAIPFFVLTGHIMERGGMSSRLVRFATALIGHWHGGLAQVNVLASMIFSGVSGSAVADASAIGGVMIPSMKQRGYPAPFLAALQACAASMGPIIPPSVIMVIYGSITGISVAKLFLAGIIPGVLVGVGMMIINRVYSARYGWGGEPKAGLREMWSSFLDSIWALLAPIILLGGIISGVFTPTEAGVVAAVYSLAISLIVYREIGIADIPELLLNAAHTTGVVAVVIAMSGIFGWILAAQEAPQLVIGAISNLTSSPAVVIALTLVILLIVGCFLDITAAAIILIPVLFPLGRKFGFDDTHFAVTMCIALVYGLVTPPVGLLLFLTSTIAEVKIGAVVRAFWPFLLMLTVVLLMTAYLPGFTLFFVRMFE